MYVNASGLENTQCVAILGTLLEKDAREFYKKQIEIGQTFRTTEQLLQCFENNFKPKIDETSMELFALRQGRFSAIEYSTKFIDLATILGVPDQILIPHFLNGLNRI